MEHFTTIACDPGFQKNNSTPNCEAVHKSDAIAVASPAAFRRTLLLASAWAEVTSRTDGVRLA
jgi:hypothetical protein